MLRLHQGETLTRGRSKVVWLTNFLRERTPRTLFQMRDTSFQKGHRARRHALPWKEEAALAARAAARGPQSFALCYPERVSRSACMGVIAVGGQ